ncbi:MAG: PLP-dependent aminotransferase family protein, partial [Candidatus Obscuribacterales bacterium]|nr:PLP-dependent aminotransferase family protein [Candidatus Obscuribacterales bacterium]
RELAKALDVSRFTVIKSYEELISQGYFQTDLGTGTFVSRRLPLAEQARLEIVDRDPASSISRNAKTFLRTQSVEAADAELFPELNYGAPAMEQLPLVQWKQILAKHSRNKESSDFEYESDPAGYLPLREALCAYLKRSRFVSCNAEQVFIFSSAQSALDLISTIFLNQGDLAAVEDPGFPGARRSFLAHGAELLPVAVDGDGLCVNLLKERPELKLLYTTPSRQDPTAVVLSADRRKELLEWASRSRAMIIEDDFDNEYRYGGALVPSLQSMDKNQSVLYLSSFWKTMFPLVRLGFLVVPPAFVNVFRAAKAMLDRDNRAIEQVVLCDFINEGLLEKHIQKTRKLYSSRRQALIYALTKGFGKSISIAKESSGMNLICRFRKDFSLEQIMKAAEDASAPLVSTSSFYANKKAVNEFLIAFAHLSEEQIAISIKSFASRLNQEQSPSWHED